MAGAQRYRDMAGKPALRPPWMVAAGYLVLAGLVLTVSMALVRGTGGTHFATVLAGLLVAIVFLVISFRKIAIPYYVWIVTIGGFRFIWSVQTPILPDLYLDRMAMVWLVLVFMVKAVAERRKYRGPLTLDLVLATHALYVLAQVVMQGMEAFHHWTTCILIPYSAYFLGKNIVITSREIRNLLWVLLVLSAYYNITSVAEKYELNWLLWPKYMVGVEGEFRGRSNGPFLQAPLFGTIIGIMLPLNLYFLATIRHAVGRVLVGTNLLVGLAALYFTYTRGSWIAGVVALAVTAALNRQSYLRYLLPALVVAPIVAVGLLGLAHDEFMKERVENDVTIGARLGTAVTVFRAWRDHPLFGVGFFQYPHVRGDYVQAVDIPGLPKIRYVQFRDTAIHDIYLGPLAENGLVGLSLQIAMFLLVWRAIREKHRLRSTGDEFARMVVPVFGGLIAGYMVGGLVIDYRFFSVIGTLFMVCAGITYGYRPDPLRASIVATGGAVSSEGPIRRLEADGSA